MFQIFLRHTDPGIGDCKFIGYRIFSGCSCTGRYGNLSSTFVVFDRIAQNIRKNLAYMEWTADHIGAGDTAGGDRFKGQFHFCRLKFQDRPAILQ